MKKIAIMMMGLLALVMSSCKHETCTLQVINEYKEPIMVLFSEDTKCSEPTEATYYAILEPNKAAQQTGVKEVEKLNAIVYIGTGELIGEKVQFKRMSHLSFKEYAGAAVVTVKVFSDGRYGVESSNM